MSRRPGTASWATAPPAPLAPVLAGIAPEAVPGTYGGDARGVRVSVAMPGANTALVLSIAVEHRAAGEDDWPWRRFRAARAALITRTRGETVELRASCVRARKACRRASANTDRS